MAYITFPCEGKRPLVTEWNTRKETVTHAEGQNYGILCGAFNNLLVIDCDLIKESEDSKKYMCGVEAWNLLKLALCLSKKIPTVSTKNGGLHLYFKYSDKLPSGIQRASGEFFGFPEKIVKIDILSDKKFRCRCWFKWLYLDRR